VLQAWASGPDGEVHPTTARAIVNAYRAAGRATAPLTIDIFGGALSAWLNWTMGRVHAAVTAKDAAERQSASGEAEALLTRPLSRTRLEALLAAL
jgi:hypothetical protein